MRTFLTLLNMYVGIKLHFTLTLEYGSGARLANTRQSLLYDKIALLSDLFRCFLNNLTHSIIFFFPFVDSMSIY